MSPLSNKYRLDFVNRVGIKNMSDDELKTILGISDNLGLPIQLVSGSSYQVSGSNYFYDGRFFDDWKVKTPDSYRHDLWECKYCKSTNHRDSLSCVHCGAGQLRSIFVGA